MFPNAFIINSVRNAQYTNNNSSSSASSQQQTVSLNVYGNIDLCEYLGGGKKIKKFRLILVLFFKVSLTNEQAMPTFGRPIISTMANLQHDERKLTQLDCKEEIIK